MRYRYRGVLGVICGVIAAGCLAPTCAAQHNPIVLLADKMAQPIDFPGIKEPVALPDALAMLSKQSGIVFYINVNSLEKAEAAAMRGPGGPRGAMVPVTTEGKAGPGGVPWDKEIVLAKQNGVRADAILKRMLAQVPRDLDYVLRRDGVEITTHRRKLDEFYRFADHPSRLDSPPPGPPAPDEEANLRYLPLVQVQFKKTPLDEALDALTEATDCSVVLDPRAADRARPITATLVNIPLDSAVNILANMCGLTVVLRDRALYVTTKENSEVMQKELRSGTSGRPFVPPGNAPANPPGLGMMGFGGFRGQPGVQGGAGAGTGSGGIGGTTGVVMPSQSFSVPRSPKVSLREPAQQPSTLLEKAAEDHGKWVVQRNGTNHAEMARVQQSRQRNLGCTVLTAAQPMRHVRRRPLPAWEAGRGRRGDGDGGCTS